MIPGPLLIIKCPSCGKRQQRQSLISGNTINARHFSDGKFIARMYPQYPYFVKCPACKVFFKITDKEVVDEESLGFASDYNLVNFLNENEYCSAITNGLYNGVDDDILSLRIELWRLFNDRIRNSSHKRFPYKNNETKGRSLNEILNPEEKYIYEDNCRKILSLMSENNEDEDYLLRAELWRNLGQFEYCLSFLNDIKNQENFVKYISAIKAACYSKNTLTVEIPHGSPSIFLF